MVSFDTIDHEILIKVVQRRVRNPHVPICFCIMLLTDGWRNSIRIVPSERFVDDAIVLCRTETEAQEVRATIAAHEGVWLEHHPEKTKTVYCGGRLLQG